MIPVKPGLEPAGFDKLVRQRGNAWLAKHKDDDPLPDLPNYWADCMDDLWAAYDGICSYAVLYIPRVTGARSVEHFVAKSSDRSLAYEWDNYRLACALVNSAKNKFDDVLDPFIAQPHWFALEFPTCAIVPGADAKGGIRDAVKATITRLKLDRDDFRQARAEWFIDWRNGDISTPHLKKKSPFVYAEVTRQGIGPKPRP